MTASPGVSRGGTANRTEVDLSSDRLDDLEIARGGTSARRAWQLTFTWMVAASDTAIVVGTTVVAILAGLTGNPLFDWPRIVSGVLSGSAIIAWLTLTRAWNSRILGTGVEEFKRLGQAFVRSSVTLGLSGLALMVDSVRPWVFVFIPLCGVFCVAGRLALRRWLHFQRASGMCMLSVLVVGDEDAVVDIVRRTRRDLGYGWRVDGACTPRGRADDGQAIAAVPIHGDLDAVGEVARTGGFDVVAVSRANGWGPARLQRLAWQLEDTDADLAVDPGVMEIAGPRMNIAPVDGMPLLRLSKPRFTGASRLLKTTLDRLGAALLLLVLLPLFISISVAVYACDGGPVFFVQRRVGARGRPFRMIKFRSMGVDAEARRAQLVQLNEGAGPLFKMRSDPRVTRVGAVLRRYSLDEFPQLLNVLTGSMSLVGPRPPLPDEVATYAADAQRRLLVRPGMTGLWQVNGRSDLSWDETVRLDLRYVENWSLALDAQILWQTVGAIVKSRGAC